MYIQQNQLVKLRETVASGKVVIIYGPRRCGKTTLLNHFMSGLTEPYLSLNGDDIETQKSLSSQSIEKLKSFIGQNKVVIIDEAQKVPNIGINLKLIVDQMSDIRVIVTGSSAFELSQQFGEPLTGRKFELKLFPLAQKEIATTENLAQTRSNLEARLLYGSYPEVIVTNDNRERARYLKELVSSYLFRDILELDGIKHSDKLAQLLQLLAFQIGSEVSCSELGTKLGMSKNTVDRYLDLLEKAFVIFHLRGFSRNLRNEITKNSRYYFLDVGVRNALINNFNPLDIRNDIGMLWENYVIVERLKKQEYDSIFSNNYFWRTHTQKEIDLIEDRGGELHGYEMKWKPQKAAPPKLWIETYKGSDYQLIHNENYLDFIV